MNAWSRKDLLALFRKTTYCKRRICSRTSTFLKIVWK